MIDFSYEVVRKDDNNKTMDVKYTASGYDPVIVGMLIPTVDEIFEEKIRLLAPICHWLQSKAQYQNVTEGLKGTIAKPVEVTPVISEEEKAKALNQQMWADVDFERRVGDALVKFKVLTSNPTAIQTTVL